LFMYMDYYNKARTHLSLNADTLILEQSAPVPRAIQAIGSIHANQIRGLLGFDFRQGQPSREVWSALLMGIWYAIGPQSSRKEQELGATPFQKNAVARIAGLDESGAGHFRGSERRTTPRSRWEPAPRPPLSLPFSPGAEREG